MFQHILGCSRIDSILFYTIRFKAKPMFSIHHNHDLYFQIVGNTSGSNFVYFFLYKLLCFVSTQKKLTYGDICKWISLHPIIRTRMLNLNKKNTQTFEQITIDIFILCSFFSNHAGAIIILFYKILMIIAIYFVNDNFLPCTGHTAVHYSWSNSICMVNLKFINCYSNRSDQSLNSFKQKALIDGREAINRWKWISIEYTTDTCVYKSRFRRNKIL